MSLLTAQKEPHLATMPVGPGRRYAPDPRDRRYTLQVGRSLFRASRFWLGGPVTHQGTLPHCVGHAWRGFLTAAPVMQRIGREIFAADFIYREAQKIDEWDGEDYDGTSVRAGAKVLQAAGQVVEYRWATNIDVVRNFLLQRGPLVVGTDWFSAMDYPEWRDDPKQGGKSNDAYIHPTGFIRGGHAYLLIGYSAQRKAYRMVNSWGTVWGEAGRAWVIEEEMDYLLFQANGEACSAVER